MSVTIADVTVTLKSDEQMLAEYQAAISTVLGGGQSYTLFGSRTVTNADMPNLEAGERKYRKRVMLAKGYVPSNHPDFRGTGGGTVGNIPEDN